MDDYDALLLPGGTVNPDQLRINDDAVGFVRDWVATGKPVGVICHGPWTLINAGVAEGRRLASWPSVRVDLANAGAEVLDQEVVTDEGLVSSRSPPRSSRSSPRAGIRRGRASEPGVTRKPVTRGGGVGCGSAPSR